MLICLDLWSINEKKTLLFSQSVVFSLSLVWLSACIFRVQHSIPLMMDLVLGMSGNRCVERSQICAIKANPRPGTEYLCFYCLAPDCLFFWQTAHYIYQRLSMASGDQRNVWHASTFEAVLYFLTFCILPRWLFFFFPLVLILDHWSAKVCSLLPVFAVWHEHRRNGLVQSEWKSFLKG